MKRITLLRHVGRNYTNLWSGGGEQKGLIQRNPPKLQENLQTADSWKLDWEEDGRWLLEVF